MNQQIKSDNKNNNNEQNDDKSIKLRFQANISKYVEKKKKELSVISVLNQKQKNIKEKRISVFSNLINRNTELNFYQQKNDDMLSAIKVNLEDRKHRASFISKKVKGHKSSLSDWRHLYDQRDGYVEKHQMSNKSPDSMAITDRLFYPSKKMTHPNFQNQKLKKAACQDNDLMQNNETNAFERSKQDNEKHFISDENYFHLYYRSSTPNVDQTDQSQKVIKYLKLNRHKRQSSQGLRLMNEAIFNPSPPKDISFIPYKEQLQRKNLSTHYKNHSFTQTSTKFLTSNPVKSSQEKPISQQLKKFSKILLRKDTKICQQSNVQNPQAQKGKKSKIIDQKKATNLSQIFSKNLKPNVNNEQLRQINLRLFKPRKNKIEKGISDVKVSNYQNTKCNFQNSLKNIKRGKTSANWNTIYGQY